MSDFEKNNISRDDGFVKGVSKEANDFIHTTVDTSGKIIKSVTGEGGLIGKTVDHSSKTFKSIKDKAFNRKENK